MSQEKPKEKPQEKPKESPISQDDEFYQYSQRCTICCQMLWAGEELASDPRNSYHMVHKGCADDYEKGYKTPSPKPQPTISPPLKRKRDDKRKVKNPRDSIRARYEPLTKK